MQREFKVPGRSQSNDDLSICSFAFRTSLNEVEVDYVNGLVLVGRMWEQASFK